MVAKLAEVASIQKKQAEKALTALVDMIKAFLAKGERIVLPGLGSFFAVAKKARTGRNPRTGTALKIPAKKAVKKDLNAPAGAKKVAAKAKPAAKKARALAAKKKKQPGRRS